MSGLDYIKEVYKSRLDQIEEVEKFNPYHDAKGRFASADGAVSFTYAPGKSRAHDLAIAREKKRHEDDVESSSGGALTNVEPQTIRATHYLRGSRSAASGVYYNNEVLDATADKDGNVTFTYATPTWRSGPGAKTNKTETVEFTIKNGAINGKTYGVNWEKVNSISGQTFNLRSTAKEAGLKWDSKNKMWVRR